MSSEAGQTTASDQRGIASVASPVIQACGLVKRYEGGRIVALDGLSFEVAPGEFVAVCGPSGCGKTTLLNVLSAIDRPDAGSAKVAGQDLSCLGSREADRFRTLTVGLVFQLHNLLPNLTALENVQVPMMAADIAPGERVSRARELLRRIGLEDRANATPPVLSGGERQRVAVARALANRPSVLLADEPTGALDSKTGERLFDLLIELQREAQTTLLVVTHDSAIAARADRVMHLLDGKLIQ